MNRGALNQGAGSGHYPDVLKGLNRKAACMQSSHINALPSLDLRALARRAALPAALAVVAVVAFVVAGGPLQAFADALSRALDADPRWIAAAVVFELLSFVGYVALLWLVGRRATRRLGLRESAEVSLGGAAATRLLPTGGVGGAALTIWAFRRAGLDTQAATRTLLAFLVVLYSVFLASIAVAGGLLALGLAPGGGPLALTAIPAIGALLVIAGALALGVRRPKGEGAVTAVAPGASRLARAQAALRLAPATVGGAVRDALALVRSGDPRLLGAVAWWAFDAAVLLAMLNALGAPPALAVVVLAYFVGQVANTIPIPGAASGGMVGVLLAFGLEADLAIASVLAYRSVAIWLPAPIGLVALGGLRQTLARWAREDAAAASLPAAAPARTRYPEPIRLPAWSGQEAAVQVPA
jgi:putative heme transporter